MTQKILIAAALTFSTVFFSCSATGDRPNSNRVSSDPTTADSRANAEQEIRTLLQEYDRAWLQQDAAAFSRLLSDEVSQIDPEGKVLSKAEIIANARSGDTKLEIGKSDDVKIRMYDNTAIATGIWTEKSTLKGRPFAGTMQFTTVCVKRNGTWQVVSDQVTPIASQQLQR